VVELLRGRVGGVKLKKLEKTETELLGYAPWLSHP